MERSSFTRKFIGNGEISGLNQLITAVTRNCCFSVSCSSFFPIFVFGNGENSVAKPQLRVASNRWQQLVPKKPDKYWQKFFLDFFFNRGYKKKTHIKIYPITNDYKRLTS